MAMARVLITSYGCSASMNDGEIMAGILKKAGHRLVSKPDAAEVIIVNTCIVKGRTESRMRNIIGRLASEFPKKKLIIAGCLPQAGLRVSAKTAAVIGPHNIAEIAEVVAFALGGRRKRAVGKTALVKVGLPKMPLNKAVNIIQILEGCSGYCAYCIVKQAKPLLCSFPGQAIIEEVKAGLKRGSREVWLTSQDNASYNAEKRAGRKDWKSGGSGDGTGRREGQREEECLAELLQEISKIDDRFFVRVGMMNPDTIMPMANGLVEAYKSPKVFRFLHIPVQAGNNRILKLMNRKYTVEDFKKLVTRFRRAIPDITISTDIIVGFPTETDDEFMDSMRLLALLRPDVLNLSRFFPRPGTAAAAMNGQVHGSITKERSERMAELFHGLRDEKNKKWIGWKGEIYVDEQGKGGSFVGRNYAYKAVVVRSEEHLLGRFVAVKIVSVGNGYLMGKLDGKIKSRASQVL
jgi:threonylcarbamoyladenosine tRNA methylthiotransferase CDKAL1